MTRFGSAPTDTFRLAIAASFTADPIEETLRYWWDALGVPAEIQFAPYNQVFQSLLDGVGPLADNRRGANVVLVRVDQWRDAPTGADDLAAAVRRSADRSPVPHLIVCCPPAPGSAASDVESRLVALLAGDARVRVVTAAAIAARYPVADYHDAYAERSADVPYTRAMFAALGTAITRALHAWLAPGPKVIAVDADNTLWDGVVGEDGTLGVRVPPARRDLQEFLLAQRAAGRLITIVSKNAEADVLAVLAEHPDMLLRPEHVTAHRINWRPKSANLAELAAELGLGLDSFAFLDDNPVECAEVGAAHPEVLALPLPADAMPFLRHCWPLDHDQVTADDAERAERYAVEARRQAARREAPSLAGFLDGLGLVVDVRSMAPADLARSAQLTQRTNQFNLTTVRRTAAELSTVDGEVLAVDVRDRFGAYGQVGLIIYRTRGDRLDVDTFLLSCRVLGRGVEHRVLAALGEVAAARGLAEVALAYAPTARNQPAYDFLTGLVGAWRDGDVFVLSTSDAAKARYEPPSLSPPPVSSPSSSLAAPVVAVHADSGLVARIATELRTAAQVLAAASPDRRFTAPAIADPTEAAVARIWAELLDFPPTSVHDNFHELGGHSLALVRFAVRVRDEFGVELPVDALFTDAFTVADVARTIRERQAGGAELDDLLAELEQLSDDEVRALLDADH